MTFISRPTCNLTWAKFIKNMIYVVSSVGIIMYTESVKPYSW